MIKSITVDEYKIISKGIKSVKERVTNIADHLKEPMDSMKFKELMVQSVMRGSKNEYKLTDEDIRRVNEISKNKFEMWEWNYGKSPKFNITKTGRFNGGKMEFKLDVNGGIIERCTVYGDFFGTVDINSFCNVLMGCKYNKESIKEALEKNNMQNVFYDINYLNLIDVIC
jgi:lipoate-protein ligase A